MLFQLASHLESFIGKKEEEDKRNMRFFIVVQRLPFSLSNKQTSIKH